MRIVYWGTYDRDRPRNRINIRGLRAQGVDVVTCHADVWKGIGDKSQLRGGRGWRLALRLAAAYPGLVYRYLCAPRHDLVVLGYLGLIDLLVIWPWARLRRVPIVWDALMSLYNTLVVDRRLFPEHSVRAWCLHALERLACRAADHVLVTTAHRRDDFMRRYRLDAGKVTGIPVGAEFDAFPERPLGPLQSPCAQPRPGVHVLFYGHFTPLHGVPTIVRAAQLGADRAYRWTLIGSGQTAPEVRRLLAAQPVPDLEWIEWVPYEELHRWIHRADVGLGFFGASKKAEETIPNKVYQLIATGTPLLTRDSPAMRELIPEGDDAGVYLVPPEDPEAILAALARFEAERAALAQIRLHCAINARVRDDVGGRRLLETLRAVAGG